MFGPDICGSSTRKVHVIINYKGENHELKSPITAETDQMSHVYTLVIRSDASYEVLPCYKRYTTTSRALAHSVMLTYARQSAA